MAKGNYHYLDGRGALVAVPCESDGKGTLTRKGETDAFCTACQSASEPGDGVFVPDEEKAKAAPTPKT